MKLKRFKLFLSKTMWKRIFCIASKEFRNSLRNGWILVLIALFLSMSLMIPFYGASGEKGEYWHDLEQAVVYMVSYMEFTAPVLGIILGYGAVVSERESGSLELLSSYPLDRGEIVAGKFLGLWALIALCIGLGLGIGGAILSTLVKDMIWAEYYLFVFSSIMLGGVYLSLSMMVSTFFKTSNSAVCASVFLLFLFNILWFFIMYAVAEATFGWESLIQGISPPTWYFSAQFLNPVMIWYTLLALNLPTLRLGAMELGGREVEVYPDIYQTWSMIAILVLWIAIPLLISEYNIRRIELN
ncbi:MAG: ABC transporter permease subunit [Thermoplasmata archaeon]